MMATVASSSIIVKAGHPAAAADFLRADLTGRHCIKAKRDEQGSDLIEGMR